MKLKLEKADNYDKCYCFYKILENNEKIGNIGIGFYKREDYLGIGDFEIYGAIWTDKGLIYVARMNEDGELELL